LAAADDHAGGGGVCELIIGSSPARAGPPASDVLHRQMLLLLLLLRLSLSPILILTVHPPPLRAEAPLGRPPDGSKLHGDVRCVAATASGRTDRQIGRQA